MKAYTYIRYLVEYNLMNIFKIQISSKKKVILTQDIIFNELLFYNSIEVDIIDKLYKEIKDIIKVYQLSNIQQQDEEYNTDSDLAQEDKYNFKDAEENYYKQEKQLDDMKTLAKGIKLMLSTLQSTLEVENNLLRAIRTSQLSREVIEDILQQNIQGEQ